MSESANSPANSIESWLKDRTETSDSRRHRRIRVALPTTITLPDGTQGAGSTVNISAGGAFVTSSVMGVIDDRVTLDIEGVGHLSGRITRISANGLGIEFNHSRHNAAHLADGLICLINGAPPSGDRRSDARNAETRKTSITLLDGRRIPCEVMDVSLNGALINVSERPPIGSSIQVGKQPGTVVRHHKTGIGVHFAN